MANTDEARVYGWTPQKLGATAGESGYAQPGAAPAATTVSSAEQASSGAPGPVAGNVTEALTNPGYAAPGIQVGSNGQVLGVVSGGPAWGTIAAADLPTGTTSTKGALQLDGTAGDILASGGQAAGATGLAADSGHVHPDALGGMKIMGSVIGWTIALPYVTAFHTPAAGNAGKLMMWRLTIPVAGTTSNFNMWVQSAANTIANVYCCLVNLSGTIVASTANRASDGVLTSTGPWSPPWSSPYPAAAGDYYGCLLIGSASTMPGFTSGPAKSAAYDNLGCTAAAGNLRVATYSSSLTSLAGLSPLTMANMVADTAPMSVTLT